MSKLIRTSPLKIVNLNKINQVSKHTNEPLLPIKESKKVRRKLLLIKLLCLLELLLEKTNRLELWKVKGGLKSTDSALKKYHENILTIQMNIFNNLQEPLEKVKRDAPLLYPRPMQLLCKQSQSLLNIEEYLPQYQLDHLGQLFVTACRLYHDLGLEDHSYITYQLALLYQCINRQGVPFIGYKNRIEARFEEIKSATKKSGVIRLDTNQIAWLQALTLDVIMQVTSNESIMKCERLFNTMHEEAL